VKILFTGFTSRTIGSDKNQYDYMCNVDVLRRALELAGHTVDARSVSLETDPCIDEEYDVALVGVAACQGLSSRYKLGACYVLDKFGKRAGIFPSDGKNVYVFPGSVRTCLTGSHGARTPLEYFFFGQLEAEQFLDAEFANANMKDVFQRVLENLPHDERNPKCAWPVLIPTFTWGNPDVYARHFGGRVSVWDPTNIAIPMQFTPMEISCNDGRLPWADPMLSQPYQRQRAWVLSTLQSQDGWLKKQACKWPVVTVGNKRKARAGEGDGYIPEKQLITEYYGKYWGHLAFGYPLADGGWWRMRYVHAGMAGIVTCTDDENSRRMPEAYRYSRIMLERWSDEKLEEVASNQWLQLMDAAASQDQAVAAVDKFVKELVK
jgi:hypothetical protein